MLARSRPRGIKPPHVIVDQNYVDRRIDERFPANVSVTVTDLTTQESGPGTLVDMSQSGVCVVLENPFAIHTVVKVEMADSVLFGYVVHMTGNAAPFRVGVEIIRVLILGPIWSSC